MVIGRTTTGRAHSSSAKSSTPTSSTMTPFRTNSPCRRLLLLPWRVLRGHERGRLHQETYDLTLTAARAMAAANPRMTFCYVSGVGTDSTEQGRTMWARVKGRTENALLALPFKAAFMFRPGFIQPMDGIRSKTGWFQAFYTLLRPALSSPPLAFSAGLHHHGPPRPRVCRGGRQWVSHDDSLLEGHRRPCRAGLTCLFRFSVLIHRAFTLFSLQG